MSRQILKKIFGNTKITKYIYSVIFDLEFYIEKKKKQKNMKKYGIKTIEFIQNILNTTGKMFFFDMGTLLGIIREGHLLKHDIDIDVGMIVNSENEKERILSLLLQNNCKLQSKYIIEELGTVEISLLMNDIKFDINYYYTDGNKSICYLMAPSKAHDEFPQKIILNKNEGRVIKLSVPSINEVSTTNILGPNINIPKNPEEYLANRYGINWRIPDKKYKYWRGNSAEFTNLIIKKRVN